MATVKEVCRDFAQTTTISGFYFIAKYRQTSIRVLWVIITIGLCIANTWQSFQSIQIYFSRPTVVISKLDYHPLTFPAVTFCSANPYVSERIKSSAPQLEEIETELHTNLYGPSPTQMSTSATIINAKHKKKRSVSQCEPGWTQVGASCYYRLNVTQTWTVALNYCAEINATLPIFYNASEYVAFANWWNTIANQTEVWLGITYDPKSYNWTWLNNCTWKHYPSFFRQAFDKNTGSGWYYQNCYAKYSNIVVYTNYAPTGVDPVPQSSISSATEEVVCYKPLDETTASCYEFPFETNSNYLCNTGGWWCATENALGQTISTAVAADSCFCLNYDNESLSSANQTCNDFNGTLADIRSDEELNLIATLNAQLITNNEIANYMCQAGFHFFNGSCFALLTVPTSGYSNPPPSLYTEQYCRTNYYPAHGASLHSFDEQWFLFHLYYGQFIGSSSIMYFYFGAYKNDTSSNFTYNWTDGSPTDFIPKWGYGSFSALENNQYNWAGISIGLCAAGGLCDDIYFYSPPVSSCRTTSSNYLLYPVVVSYVTSTNATSTQQLNLLNSDNSISKGDLDTMYGSNTVLSKLCRKDRNLQTTTTSSTSSSNLYVTEQSTTSTTFIPSTSTQQESSHTTTSATSTSSSSPSSLLSSSSSSPTSTSTEETTSTVLSTTSTSTSSTSQLTTTIKITTTTSPASTIAFSTESMRTASPEPFIFKGDGLNAISEAQEKLLYAASSMDPELLSNLSYSLDDLMSYCSFNGTTCLKKNFKKQFYPSVGNCYTYNFLNNPLLSVSGSGSQNGLTMILYSDASSYLLTSLSPGFLIAIHDQNDTIFPDTESMRISVGQWNLFSLTMSVLTLQPYPYSNCIDTDLKQNENYSVEGCNRLCMQNEVLNSCGCGDPSLPIPTGKQYCNYNLSSCVNQVKNTSNVTCMCNPTCKSVLFALTSSVAKLRNTNQQGISTCGSSNDLLSQNAVLINIFYNTLNFITYEQVCAYSWQSLLSDLSNFLGLWLGFSVLTFFEFIPFAISLSSAICTKTE